MAGNAHARALFTTPAIVALQIVEAKFTTVTVVSFNIFLQVRESERDGGKSVRGAEAAKFYELSSNMSTEHVIGVLMW